jgi:hypothetical protein
VASSGEILAGARLKHGFSRQLKARDRIALMKNTEEPDHDTIYLLPDGAGEKIRAWLERMYGEPLRKRTSKPRKPRRDMPKP